MAGIQLIVGLGNPGLKYDQTRHNAGFWFLDRVAQSTGQSLKANSRFNGETAKANVEGQDVWLLKPTTFMNHSGQAAGALAAYYKIAPECVLAVHDDLDLPPGAARLKQGGGHGGHNGLRSMVAHLGTSDFARLRIGIGHPGERDQVINYVLSKPGKEERARIEAAIDEARDLLPLLVEGDFERAMTRLHSR